MFARATSLRRQSVQGRAAWLAVDILASSPRFHCIYHTSVRVLGDSRHALKDCLCALLASPLVITTSFRQRY